METTILSDETPVSWRAAAEPIPTLLRMYKDKPFAGTLLVGAFVLLKVYVLAKADITTAVGILQYTTLTTVVLAGILSALPILAAGMLAFSTYKSGLAWRKKWSDYRRRHMVTLLALFVALLIAPWPYVVAALAVGLLLLLVDRSRRGRATGVVAAVISLVAVVFMLYSVWVPHEIITFTSPKTTPIVGYVLSEDNGWITILTSGGSNEHTIVRYPEDTVATQTVCEQHPHSVVTQFSEASTTWDHVTDNWLLGWLHPVTNLSCQSVHDHT